MREQQKSKTYRYGEPEAHKQAVEIVIDFLDRFVCDPVEETGFDTGQNWYFAFDDEFLKKMNWTRNDSRLSREHFEHKYDIVLLSDVGLSSKEFCFIEVDGEKHEKKAQKINDGIAEAFALHKFKGTVPVIRLLVRELLGTKADREIHLREKLGGLTLR